MTRINRVSALASMAFAGLLAASPVRAGAPLQHPSGLVVDRTGVLWVANSGANTVQSFNISVLPPTPGLAITQDLDNPTRLATLKGNLYVANTSGNTVTVYTAATGAEVTSAKISGLSHPLGVAVDTQGNVFVANNGNNSVQGFSALGTPLGTVSSDTTSAFQAPSTLRIQNGTLFLGLGPKVGTSSVREYDPTTFFNGTPTPTTVLTAGISGPTGVTLSRDLTLLLVADLYASNVSRYLVQTGAQLGGINHNVAFPEGIAVDGSGRIFVSNARTSSISVFTAKGVFITSF